MKRNIERKIKNLLSSVNLRRTVPRMAILGVLLKASRPITQEQVAEYLAPETADKVTIYRTLENFLKAGLVHKAFLHERTWHFELAHHCTKNQCHPHFTCTNCGNTNCLTEVSLPLTKNVRKGFVIHRQRVQFEGLCPQCSKK